MNVPAWYAATSPASDVGLPSRELLAELVILRDLAEALRRDLAVLAGRHAVADSVLRRELALCYSRASELILRLGARGRDPHELGRGFRGLRVSASGRSVSLLPVRP